jgi:hypothetical protein
VGWERETGREGKEGGREGGRKKRVNNSFVFKSSESQAVVVQAYNPSYLGG